MHTYSIAASSIVATLLRSLAMTFALAAAAFGQSDEPNYAKELPADYVTSSQDILAYNRAIREMESREGAYAAGLPETLMGLARLLQSQQRHEEAIELFKRGVHLARINEGLYCTQQISLLQGEIASHIALQRYDEVEERQNYLYRVQTKALGSSEALVDAIMQHASWQFAAYKRGTPQDYWRLINMLELYRTAFDDVVAREGNQSPALLPPLYGMLQAQYLISSYDIRPSTPVFDENGQPDEELMRFKSYHNKSYEQGNAIIAAIGDIERERSTPDLARSLVMLGDWRLWNGETEAAWEAYRKAAAELARAGDAQAQTQRLFGEPVALPDFAELSFLPPVAEHRDNAITLAFDVNEYGKVRDIEWLNANAEADRQATRLMRQLRNTPFRPRFEAGQPVETEKLVKAFHIQ